MKGAMVGDTVTLNGLGNFRYDESLANFGGTNPCRVVKWRELVSESQRSLYNSRLRF